MCYIKRAIWQIFSRQIYSKCEKLLISNEEPYKCQSQHKINKKLSKEEVNKEK